MLKVEWSKLVNMMAAVKSAVSLFDTERRSGMSARAVVESFQDEHENYDIALEKIAEITAARALTRPEPSGKTRKDIVVAANVVIKELGATLPPPLVRLVAPFLPGKQ